MTRYYGYSALFHAFLFLALLVPMWLHPTTPPNIFDFEFVGDGGGGGGGGGGAPKKSDIGQVVPNPVKIPVPARPAPVQHAEKAEDAWRVKNAKPEIKKNEPTQAVAVPHGEKTQVEKTNVVSRGVDPNPTTGEGGFDFGKEGAGKGPGVGIGVGPGSGGGVGGGFGFGSYLGILRRRIWQEWTQSSVYGVNQACVVGLTVTRSGDVRDIKVEKSSGNSFYDTVALRAVRNSSPLPPLPSGFPNPEQRFRIAFRLIE